MTLPLRVLGDRILIKPDVDEHAPEQVGSVFVAKSLAAAVTGSDAVNSVCRGTVVAVGTPKHPLHDEAAILADTCEGYGLISSSETLKHTWHDAAHMIRDLVRKQPSASIGDDVLFSADAGQRIDLEDESYIILHDADLLAIVEPEDVHV